MDHNKARSFFGGRGFYIALVLCLAAIGVAGYFALVQQAKVAEEDKNTPVVRQEPVENIQQPEVKPDPEPVQETLQPEELLPQVCSPLDGTTVTVFSMTELMYDETMADWRTHDGIDIAAAAGTVVKAAAGGVVESVYTDDLYGTTVVINHGDGLKSCYANLQEVPAVAEGNRVSAGDTIGAVGRTALCETAEPYHLHLSMSLNGESVNPRDYLPQL